MHRNPLSRPLTRRQLVLGMTAVTVLPARAFAQSTPLVGTPGVGMGYPELTVTITDQGLKASATQIPAGYVLLTVVNQSKQDDSAGLIGPGPGQTMDQLKQAVATPVPGGQFPPFLYHATVLGGPGDIQPGASGSAIIHVAAGDWAIFEEGNLPPLFVTATTGGASQSAPQAAVTITEVDFAFGGFGVAIPAGKQLWQVVNAGIQPHMLVVFGVPAGTTLVQALAAVSRPANATPAPGELSPKDIRPVNPGGVLLQSPGTTVWPLLDLPAGRYAALCFVTDPRTGQPHAMEGMVTIFDVGTTGTPGATPGATPAS